MSNSKKDFVPLQQGSLDGLCGIYAVLNFFKWRLALNDDDEADRTLLRKMLRVGLVAAEGAESISIANYQNGFRQGQLRKAFTEIDEISKTQVVAHTMISYAKSERFENVFQLLQSLAENEAAVLRLRDPNHWVLAFGGTSSQFLIADSAAGTDLRFARTSLVEERKIELKRGLVLTNAQTH